MKEAPNIDPRTGRTPAKNEMKAKTPIDWELVKKLAQIQCTGEEIAAFLDISYDCLRTAVKENYDCNASVLFREWRKGGHCSLRRKQWKLADANATMAIFLGKQYLGQEDDYGMRHSGNVPITVTNFGDGEAEPWKSTDEEKK